MAAPSASSQQPDHGRISEEVTGLSYRTELLDDAPCFGGNDVRQLRLRIPATQMRK